jgi:PAS domain S-box-containing protein
MPTKPLTTLTAASGLFTGELTPDLFLIVDSIPDGLYGVDPSGRTVFVNRSAAMMLGHEPHELIGRVPHQVMHHTRPDGTPYPAEECPLFRAAMEGTKLRVEEDLFWRSDGSSFPVEYESHPLRRGSDLVGFIVTFRDISARKKNEERVRELLRDQFALAKAEFQHAQLREVLKQTPAVICVTRGPRHLIEVVNDQFYELAGNTDVVGKPVSEAIPAKDEQMIGAMTLAYETGVAQRGQELAVAVQTPDGPQTKFFDYIYQPLRDESGYVYGLMTHAVDVTDTVQSRRALEARTQELESVAARLRLAAEAGRLGTWEWELPARRVSWSPEIERIHGLELGTFAGTFEAYQADLHPDDRERVLAHVEDTIANRTPYLIEYRIIRPDNEVRWIEARGQMFLGAEGQPERVVGICMDITERKRAEATVLEAERVSRERAEELTHLTDALKRMNAELDAFAYAASHDLRAPLRGIANLAQWIEEDLSASGELKPDTSEMLGLMRSRMHRMEALIEGILQYSRAGRVDTKVEHVDTHRLVKEVVDLVSARGATVEIADMPTLETTLLPLQQVFMNLIGNALKYADRPDPVVRVTGRDDGRFYEFSVSDNGPGIPAEYHSRIWGIFQSLEARDKVEATGIGLSLVKKLVEANGGRAWVESTPGQGATFRFLWPKQIRGSLGS